MKKGFTLIELLVVISIISLFSSVVLASLNSARQKARDAAGKQFAASVERVAGDQAEVYLDFNGCSSVPVDSSGNNHTFSVSGAVAYSSDTPYATGCSFSASGSNSVSAVNAAIASFSNASAFTISLWVKTSTSQSRAGFVSTAVWPSNGYMLAMGYTSASTRPVFVVNGSSGNLIEASNNMPVGEWVNLVGVYDGIKMYLYQNGSLIGSVNASGVGANTNNLTIGRSTQGGWGAFTGLIDNVRIYSKSLTAFDVKENYLAEVPLFLGRK